MTEEIRTTIREIRSLDAAIKKATRMKEARTLKLIDCWNEMKAKNGLTLNEAASLSGLPRHSLVNNFYGSGGRFDADRWMHFFEKLFSHIRKKSLAVREDG